MTSVYVELVTPLNECSLVCRGCLADSGEMKNIREWGLTQDFYKLTDVMLHNDDGISELLCTACEDALMMSKRFRSRCQQSDVILRNIAAKNAEESPQNSTASKNTVTFILEDEQLTFKIYAPDSDAKILLPCFNSCSDAYVKKKDLLTHLIRNHNVHKDYKIDVRYFCHHENCPYNESTNNGKWFTKRKVLNQHYNKVHKSKIFHCDKCGTNFPLTTDFNRHLKNCNVVFKCDLCNLTYQTDERLLVHLMRHHPDLHKQYKNAKKAEKRKSQMESHMKRLKTEEKYDYICDSPKRSFATQTLENTVKNDLVLSWPNTPSKDLTKTDEISTQTVFEDLLSLKAQSEDDSMFFSETVSISDIQTQTFPLEFESSRSNKETLTDPDMSMKETQTCVCNYDCPKFRLFDSVSSSPSCGNLTSTETQTIEFRSNITDVLLSFSSAQTQTCFDSNSEPM